MKISVSPSVLLMGSVLLLSGKADRAVIPLVAALIHECGHILFSFIFSIQIEKIELNLFGALIKIPPLSCSYNREAMLAAAGPMANVVTSAIAAAYLGQVSEIYREGIIYFIISSLLFAFINLLPAENLDGGRMLSCFLLARLSPNTVHKIIEWTSLFCIFMLWSMSVYFIIRTGSYLSLFVFSGALFSKIFLFEDSHGD